MFKTGAEERERVAKRLEALGYRVLAHGFAGEHGEIDLVARDGRKLAFIAIWEAGEPAPRQAERERLIRTAAEYIALNGWWHFEARFDAVLLDKDSPEEMHLLLDAI